MHEGEFQPFQKIVPVLIIWQISSDNFAAMGLAWVVVVAQLNCRGNIVREQKLGLLDTILSPREIFLAVQPQ